MIDYSTVCAILQSPSLFGSVRVVLLLWVCVALSVFLVGHVSMCECKFTTPAPVTSAVFAS